MKILNAKRSNHLLHLTVITFSLLCSVSQAEQIEERPDFFLEPKAGLTFLSTMMVPGASQQNSTFGFFGGLGVQYYVSQHIGFFGGLEIIKRGGIYSTLQNSNINLSMNILEVPFGIAFMTSSGKYSSSVSHIIKLGGIMSLPMATSLSVGGLNFSTQVAAGFLLESTTYFSVTNGLELGPVIGTKLGLSSLFKNPKTTGGLSYNEFMIGLSARIGV